MAEAYECDRCGSLHSGPPEALITLGDGLERGRASSPTGETDTHFHSPPPADEALDICPGCEAAFEEWLEDD